MPRHLLQGDAGKDGIGISTAADRVESDAVVSAQDGPRERVLVIGKARGRRGFFRPLAFRPTPI
jgi:hypothetical protein